MKKNYFNVALSVTLIVSMFLPNFAMTLGNEQEINYTDAMGAGGYDGGGSDYYEEIRKENLAKSL